FEITLGGKVYKLNYVWGSIDEERRSKITVGNDDKNKLKAYYLQNMSTQGIDIRIGKRVIATKVLEHIWGRKSHNDYNDFSGELIIPDTVPRGVLKTVTTKTDFKQDDTDWNTIFSYLSNNYPLIRNSKSQTEEQFKQKLENHIKSLTTTPEFDIITREKTVFPTGVKIDVYWKKFKTDEVIIYEVKTQTASSLDLYQLKMYWDGLVEKNEHPTSAYLVCLDYKTPLEEMVKILNKLNPKEGFENYNFILKSLKDMHLL
ncbi:MAG: ATP-binding protein, partial [Chitinophaga sp.]|nr:ATP-binding protein [Chitinophaga sp.]